MPDLNAFGSFQSGFSLGDAVQQRNLEQQKFNYEIQQNTLKQQQAKALQDLSLQAFNNPEALKMVYGQNRDLGESIAKERDKYNRVTSMAIGDVLGVPPEQRAENWNRSKALLAARGIDTSDLSDKYSPEVEQSLKQKQAELKTWDDTFKTIDTAQGVMRLSEKTGEVSPTGLGVYVKPPSTLVNINNQEQDSFYKEFGKTKGAEYAGILKSGRQAGTDVGKLERTETLLNRMSTGKLTPTVASLGNVINQTGLIKVDPKKVADIEELSQLSKDQAGAILSSGQYGSGSGISSADLIAAQGRVFSADKTVQGNLRIVNTLKRLDQRSIDAAKTVNQMIAKKAPLSDIEGALQALSSKPLFPEDQKTSNQNYSDQDIKHTATKYGITEEEVRRRLQNNNGS